MKALAFVLVVALVGCMPAQQPERTPCSSAALAIIEANYVAAILAACGDHDSIEACPAAAPIEKDFSAQREEWIACR